jgi:hypothetical protein
MRKIVAATFVSLDGVMQAPGGPEEDPTGGFKFGGWTATYWDDAVGAAIGEGFTKPFDLLIGRRTVASRQVVYLGDSEAARERALNSAVASERLCGGHRWFSGKGRVADTNLIRRNHR